eukprot:Gb_12816 [translate_table: standard]
MKNRDECKKKIYIVKIRMARAELRLQSLPQLLKQAAVSYKASIWIFLTIALLSSLYETAIENATDLSGFSFNLPNANYSIEFDLHGKTNSRTPVDNKGNETNPGEVDSVLGRFLTALLAPISAQEANTPIKELVQQKKEQISDNQVEILVRDGSVHTDSQEFAHNEIKYGNQLFKSNEDKLKQPNEIENESNMAQNKRLDETESAHNEKSNKSDSVYHADNEKPNALEGAQDGKPNELENESKSTHDAIRYGDGIIQPPLAGSWKMVNRFGNETKTKNGQRLQKPQARTASSKGAFNRGAIPSGVREGTLLLILLVILAISMVILLVLTFQSAAVIGVVAYAVASTHMGKRTSVKQSLRSALRFDIWRLMWFAILVGTLHEIQTQFLTKILFGEVMAKDQIEKLVNRLSLMPFAVLAPLKDDCAVNIGMSLRIGAFVIFQYLFDWLVYSTYIVGCWVSIMEKQYSGREALNRGWNLLKSMAFQAVTIKILESVLCGRSFSWMLNKPDAKKMRERQGPFLTGIWRTFWKNSGRLIFGSDNCNGTCSSYFVQYHGLHVHDYLQSMRACQKIRSK